MRPLPLFTLLAFALPLFFFNMLVTLAFTLT